MTEKRQRLNSGQMMLDESETESERSEAAVRTSPGSKGYLRLAVVLGMMCCSSFMDGTQNDKVI